MQRDEGRSENARSEAILRILDFILKAVGICSKVFSRGNKIRYIFYKEHSCLVENRLEVVG